LFIYFVCWFIYCYSFNENEDDLVMDREAVGGGGVLDYLLLFNDNEDDLGMEREAVGG